MSQPIALVTGAGGEMGHLLIPALREQGVGVIALDLVELDESIREQCVETVTASILETDVLADLIGRHTPTYVFHLAAVLSRKAEIEPDLAHRVNVDGTYELLKLCRRAPEQTPVRFMFPSSIAVYGLPNPTVKQEAGAVKETEWTVPSGVYGCNKLYCELLGAHLTRTPGMPDFRSIRFPGLISAETLPAGGTTDYAPEMIHAAAQGRSYKCFVLRDAKLPFMTMPDGIDALVRLALADPGRLSRRAYNVRGFASKASDIRSEVLKHYPEADIGFDPDPARQVLVDSWPEDVDDTLAQKDWGFSPKHGLSQALSDYLVPAMKKRYAAVAGG
ncbi:MAG: NAD-dependent epimerase/dehydratase family protein [Acidobacteria bacterium]|nr:NAD-dependent epimerase/dehydratase family protein [Acidobacteriota bacterium]NIM63370.1 NAD-dependent epimerase/dehydratase family protein [Acidobacteriota bacterium]NIO60079.1 NAD-dependent epimerase/dehydratase family protein [Acidobacteriota bacterium]NIQ31487.1 NAD-dependent epimerase/dehydratase family protein [Acidobacteriota bacterium]NIQ86262.1 NAD-dependent epimerase/dehydratase family protein [Acidobacteriota bacterium]